MMPGTRLMHFARRWFPPSTVSSVFEPLVADWQRQWNDATPAERRWINAKGFAAFATTTVMMTPRLALEAEAFHARPLLLAGGFWLLTSCLVTLPFAREGFSPEQLLFLLPASLTMMLPFAILPAIDAIRRDGDTPTERQRRAAITLAVLAAMGVTVGQGWLTPASNQHFRNDVATERSGRPTLVSRGIKEYTTSELIAGDVASTPALYGMPRVRELNNRVALAMLPTVLVWLRWRSLSRLRTRSWPVLKSCFLAIGATTAFLAVMTAGPSLERIFLAPGFGPTLALALFAFTARTGIWWRQRTA
jgi:hypothetical protein